MKRFLAIGVILIICMGLVVGCGGNSSELQNEKNLEATEQTEQTQPTEPAEQTQPTEPAELAEQTQAEKDVTTIGNETINNNEVKTLDKYQTSPVPEGKPAPSEPENTDADKKIVLHGTLLITCNTILDNMEKFDESKLEVLPEDGIVFYSDDVEFYEGESVFDLLLRQTREEKIHMEFVSTPMYNSSYIEGINNIYEFDCGELSGWMYKVNDWFANYGSSRYLLKNGDKIEWVYTCDLGEDVGGDWSAQQTGRE